MNFMDTVFLNRHVQCDQNQLIPCMTKITQNFVLLYNAYIYMVHNGQVNMTGNKYFIHLIQR
jgi:hypothetical protein